MVLSVRQLTNLFGSQRPSIVCLGFRFVPGDVPLGWVSVLGPAGALPVGYLEAVDDFHQRLHRQVVAVRFRVPGPPERRRRIRWEVLDDVFQFGPRKLRGANVIDVEPAVEKVGS